MDMRGTVRSERGVMDPAVLMYMCVCVSASVCTCTCACTHRLQAHGCFEGHSLKVGFLMELMSKINLERQTIIRQ